MSRVLGLDYGIKHIGVAISAGSLAEPLVSLENNAQFVSELKKIIDTYQVDQVVLGCSQGEMAKKTRIFGQNLKKNLKLPLTYVDETLSSKEAMAGRVWLGGKKRRRGPIHQFAAAIILERFLDERPL